VAAVVVAAAAVVVAAVDAGADRLMIGLMDGAA
jgi:hypothetical protein